MLNILWRKIEDRLRRERETGPAKGVAAPGERSAAVATDLTDHITDEGAREGLGSAP